MRYQIIFKFTCLLIVAFPFISEGQNTSIIRANLLANANSDSLIVFDHKAGFYDNPFTLSLKAQTASDSIIYTLDGSNPFFRKNSFAVLGSATISIDPDNTSGRGKTPAVIVKATVKHNGVVMPYPVSQTYLFVAKVLTQTYPSGSWPKKSVNSQVVDYDMDQDIVTNSAYANIIKPALMSLPSLSISTNPENLFNDRIGIYVNAGERGNAWERECSVELLNPDGSVGFSENAGLRIRGGSSRNDKNPKHSLRLFFSSDYGATKLNYPLFGTEGAEKFDKVDLRTEQNYSWNGDDQENKHNTFVREIFSRDMQGLMNQPYSRGRYYHLYLNGMYWGIYQTDERTDASFANSYFDGKKSDYDVIKVTPESFPYQNEVTDGNDEIWKKLYNMCGDGFKSNGSYFRLEGKDENGNHVNGSNVLVDIDNLIDYMLLIFYTGNFDAPASAFWGNKMPNNYYAIYNRNNYASGFIFLAHDSEHSLMVDPVFVGAGLYEDRVNMAEFTGWYNFDITKFEDFNPQWLHYKLTKNYEYRQRFADRAIEYFKPGGIFTPERATAICQNRINEVKTAIVAESARWGDAKRTNPRTRDDDWQAEINVLLNDFFPYRTDIVIEQLDFAKLYLAIEKPEFLLNSTPITTNSYYFKDETTLTIKKPDGLSGTIYYTTDGSDPRKIGGGYSSISISSDNDIELTLSKTTIITARIRKDARWGPLRRINCLTESTDLTSLKVTEINYHPVEKIIGTDTISDKDMEFIEFKNTGSECLNISGLKLDSAITYTFPENSILAPGKFFVLASDSLTFASIYGIYPSGEYKGKLANSGELIVLNDKSGNNLFTISYMDASPWPEEADGKGYSLTSTSNNPTDNPGDYAYWKISSMEGGSPFADDTVYRFVSEKTVVANQLSVYPNPTNNIVNIQTGRNSEFVTVQLFNQSGQCVFSSKINQPFYTLSLKELNQSAGIYFIKLIGNNWIETKKVILME